MSELTAVQWAFTGLSLIYLIWNIDSLWIDWLIFWRKIRPQALTQKEWFEIQALPERKIAILIPTWREENVITRMLLGNSQHILYRNYQIFVGCYPNDWPTLRAVTQVQNQNPQVRVLLSSIPGPTSKGHLLNEMVDQLRKETHSPFDIVLFHDAEDIIHPRSLALINKYSHDYDFIQLPVFSLQVPRSFCVSASYMDEFAEAHTRELLCRNQVRASVPSAGVGMAITRAGLEKMVQSSGGKLLESKCLTEDYLLGIKAFSLGLRQVFACHFYEERSGKKNWVATREFFPNSVGTAVRQKARWTEGIALQSPTHLEWFGSMTNRVFLLRDRKALLGNSAGFCGFLILPALLSGVVELGPNPWPLKVLLICNFLVILNRLFHRSLSAAKIYGAHQALWVILRYPISIWVNGLASFRALKNYWVSQWMQKPSVWVKTQHELPENFGTPVATSRVGL